MTADGALTPAGDQRESPAAKARTPGWRVWWGLLVAPSAWLAMEGVGYYVTARSCDVPGGLRGLGPTHPRAVVSVLALVLTATAVSGLLLAVESRRQVRGDTQAGRASFLATAGVVGSAVFTGGIVLFAVPALVLDICSQARW